MNSTIFEFLMKLDLDSIPNNHNYSGEIFHYTALKNIESILLSPQNEIVLWASQFDCLNDISEGTIVEQAYNRVCKRLKANSEISSELYNIFINIKPSKNETFMIFDNGKPKPYRGEYTTYISSFSKNKDLLPMWNYYSKGDMFEGINLGMDAEIIASHLEQLFAKGTVKTAVNPVVYDAIEQEEIIKEFLLKIVDKYESRFERSARAIISMKLTSWKALFKQECFKHEQEVRIIVQVANKYQSTLPIRFRTTAGYIIPYIELKIDKKALKSVTLGPFRGTESQMKLQKSTLSDMLILNNYNTDINTSQIPVRY